MKLQHSVDVPTQTRHPAEPMSVKELRAVARRLAAAYPHTPLPVIHEELAAVRRGAVNSPGDPDGPPRDRVDHLTAVLARGLSARARHDLGDTREALALAQSAVMYAALDARHASLEVWMRGMQSLVAYRAGWVHEALRYARLGASARDESVGSATIWLHSLVAMSQAALGDSLAASAALREAETARTYLRRDELDEIGGLLYFDPIRQQVYEAETRAFIPGAERRAIERAEAALMEYSAVEPAGYSCVDEAAARVVVALAHASLDDAEATEEALRPVFRLEPGWRVAGLLSSVMIVHGRLRRPMRAREARVRELQEEIENFCQTPLTLGANT